jgi:hypothetical protein
LIPVDLNAQSLRGLNARFPQRYPVLLESASGDMALGRYDLLLAAPGEQLQLAADGLSGPPSYGGRTDRFSMRINGGFASGRGIGRRMSSRALVPYQATARKEIEPSLDAGIPATRDRLAHGSVATDAAPGAPGRREADSIEHLHERLRADAALKRKRRRNSRAHPS